MACKHIFTKVNTFILSFVNSQKVMNFIEKVMVFLNNSSERRLVILTLIYNFNKAYLLVNYVH